MTVQIGLITGQGDTGVTTKNHPNGEKVVLDGDRLHVLGASIGLGQKRKVVRTYNWENVAWYE